jgi:hypothetical protein
MVITEAGNVGIGVTAPTAALHLKASTATANTASLKIDAGTLATSAVSGNVESDGTHFYWTDSGNTRRQLDQQAPAASDSAAGIVELTIASEVTTGTSTSLAVTPEALSGSDYGKRVVQIALNGATAITTSDKAYFRVPSVMNGWNLVGVAAMCQTASSSGVPTFTIKNGATSMLSTNLTIDAGETDSSTAAAAAVIDTAEDDVATGNQIEVACSVAGTGTLWVVCELVFQLP